ncbi:hypothetical protein SAMN02799622_02732 [Methylobacterium sp. UNC378MF]|nr:hypothetical protein SAMN02799622_02732 [Methylobacterium sp. UNC378MF]
MDGRETPRSVAQDRGKARPSEASRMAARSVPYGSAAEGIDEIIRHGYFNRQRANHNPVFEVRIFLNGLCLQQKNARQPVLRRRSPVCG